MYCMCRRHLRITTTIASISINHRINLHCRQKKNLPTNGFLFFSERGKIPFSRSMSCSYLTCCNMCCSSYHQQVNAIEILIITIDRILYKNYIFYFSFELHPYNLFHFFFFISFDRTHIFSAVNMFYY